jgi:hypothetical protein
MGPADPKASGRYGGTEGMKGRACAGVDGMFLTSGPLTFSETTGHQGSSGNEEDCCLGGKVEEMHGFLRRIRGIIGTGLTWAAAWIGLGAGLGALAGYPLTHLVRIALSNSVGGFIAGASFAVILSVAERRRTLRDLSLKRVALWGAIGGFLVTSIPLAFGAPVAFLLGPLVINGFIGAGLAAGSVAMARRSEERRLTPGAADPLLGMGRS